MQHENTFRLAMSHGREYLLQANDESNMNEWVSLINWAAASKTLGIPTTSMPLKEEDGAAHPDGIDNAVADVGLTLINSGSEAGAKHQSQNIVGSWLHDRDSALASPLPLPVGDKPLPYQSGHIDWDLSKSIIQEIKERSLGLADKIKEELRLVRNLELLVVVSRTSQDHITSLFLLMAENIRRWRAELAKLNSIQIRRSIQ